MLMIKNRMIPLTSPPLSFLRGSSARSVYPFFCLLNNNEGRTAYAVFVIFLRPISFGNFGYRVKHVRTPSALTHKHIYACACHGGCNGEGNRLAISRGARRRGAAHVLCQRVAMEGGAHLARVQAVLLKVGLPASPARGPSLRLRRRTMRGCRWRARCTSGGAAGPFG